MNKTSNYIQIAPDTFRNDTYRPFDVYFSSKDGTMVLYCSMGDRLAEGFREKLHRDHIIDRLYIKAKDKANYDLYMETSLTDFFSSRELSCERKAELALETIRTTASALFESPKADFIRRYEKTVLATMNFVLEESTAFRALLSKLSMDDGLLNHSVNVGILALGLTAALLDRGIDIDYNEAIPGFFLHDIGKTAIPREILSKNGPMSRVDWKIMRRHPETGCQIIRNCQMLTSDIRYIVSQHHERHSGSGYPNGLRGTEIHFNAKICAIADIFDGLTSYRSYRKEHSTYGALTVMKNELSGEFDPRLFATFVSLFG